MELSDLNAQEKIVLAAVVKFAVMADGRVTENEVDELHHIIEAVGDHAWRDALDGARAEMRDVPSLEALLATVERPEAREIIYGTVLELAEEDAVDSGEGKLLETIERTWGVHAEIASDGAEEE